MLGSIGHDIKNMLMPISSGMELLRNDLWDHFKSLPIDTVSFSKGRRVFLVECGFHEFMQTCGVLVDTPSFALTDASGSFTLTDVPQGVYRLVAWHPGLGGILWSEVAVLRGETVKTSFEFQAPPPRRSANTTMVDHPHYDVEVLGLLGDSVEISPTHEVQAP